MISIITNTYPAGCTSSRTGISKARTTFINTFTSLTVRFWEEAKLSVSNEKNEMLC